MPAETTGSAESAVLAGLIDARLPWRRVSAAAADGQPLAWTWAELLSPAPAGGDPTADWRAALTDATARQYGVPPPPAMPAAFVLQWALEVPAILGAYAAVLGPWAADLSPAAVSFELDPVQLYPAHLQVRAAGTLEGGPESRLAVARAAYERLARPFAEGYQPGVHLGAHQRRCMVDDVWEIAAHGARQPVAGSSAPPPARSSCCFVYALPGAHECAGCPRRRRLTG